jgi:peptide/nickel transport system permease protein
MLQYTLRRLLQLLPVIIGVSLLVFFAMHILPGDVATLLLGDRATKQQLVQLRHQLGLDKPIWVQYWAFLTSALQGDFGVSLRTNHPALRMVLQAFPVTFQLSVAALLVALAAGLPLGVLAGVRPGGWLDNAVLGVSLIGVSMPIFWLGLMLILVFGAHLNWLPIGGVLDIGQSVHRITGMPVLDAALEGRWSAFSSAVRHLILPAVTLATIPLALITRITRAEVVGALNHDYVRTARAKGVRERGVVLRHALRNGMIPVVTVVGLQFGLLLSGAVLTETIFSLPGLGRLMVDSILNRDYPVVQAGAIVVALVFVIINLLVDISYAYLDPRIRYQ